MKHKNDTPSRSMTAIQLNTFDFNCCKNLAIAVVHRAILDMDECFINKETDIAQFWWTLALIDIDSNLESAVKVNNSPTISESDNSKCHELYKW